MVERRTVEESADILRSLVRIRLDGNFFNFFICGNDYQCTEKRRERILPDLERHFRRVVCLWDACHSQNLRCKEYTVHIVGNRILQLYHRDEWYIHDIASMTFQRFRTSGVVRESLLRLFYSSIPMLDERMAKGYIWTLVIMSECNKNCL